MTGTIFLRGTARRKSSGAEARFAGACQDKHAGRPAPIAWGGLAKGNQSVQQAKARVDFLVGTWRKEISRCNKPRLRGLGPEACGPGLEGRTVQGLCRGLGFRARTTATPEASTGQWVMLVKSRVLRSNYDWHDILTRDCAQEFKRCKKPDFPERVRTNTQAVLLLAWGGLAKGNQSVQQAEASVVSGKSRSVRVISHGLGSQGLGAQGLGPGPPGAWGPAVFSSF